MPVKGILAMAVVCVFAGTYPRKSMGLMVFIIIAGGIIYLFVDTTNKREAKKKELYEAYQKALAFGNKGHASLAGRTYYSYLRKGIPTLADEEAILNDIAAMK